MRRSILLFLLLILFLSCCGVSFASTDTIILTGPVDYPFLGFRFDPPEAYLNTKGIVTLAGPYETNDIVREVICTYYAMPEDRYDRLFNSGHKSLLEEKDLWSTSIFAVVSMDRGMTFREFCTYTGQPYDEQYVREIGKNGDTTYYLMMEALNRDLMEDMDPSYLDEYVAMAAGGDDLAASFTFCEPEETPVPYAGLVGSRIEFTSADLDGNPVSSAELFGQNEITVLNIWATWCGPCIGELEDLQSIHKNYQAKGAGVLGLLYDDDLDTARQLMEEYHVRYPNILAPETLNDFFPVEALPSTLFIGRDGSVLAGPELGANVARYKTILNELLRQKGSH